MKSRVLSRWLPWAAALLGVAAAFWLLPFGELLSTDALQRHRAVLRGWVAAQPVATAAGYVAVYAATVALAVPGAVLLTVAGGLLFGAALGSLLAACGATAGACVVFLLARRLFGTAAPRGPRAAALVAALRRDAGPWLLAVRLVPLLPFVLVNLAAAYAGIPLRTYVWATALGILPATTAYALAGAGLDAALAAEGGFDPRAVLTPGLLAALVGLAALSLAAIPLRRRLG